MLLVIFLGLAASMFLHRTGQKKKRDAKLQDNKKA
jgi:hypothetical protein